MVVLILGIESEVLALSKGSRSSFCVWRVGLTTIGLSGEGLKFINTECTSM